MALSSGSVTLSVAVFLASEEEGGESLASGILLTCESLESLETAPVHCLFLCGVYQGLAKDLMSTALESIACAVAAAGSVFFWVVFDQIGERKMFARRAKVVS